MNILQVHNYYTEKGGGEDQVFKAEKELLEARGHTVRRFIADNSDASSVNPIRVAVEAIWSRLSSTELRSELHRVQYDVAHFHNIFFRISPSAYHACHSMGIPVVQTVHNYRMFCPAATLYRDGKPCRDCVGKMIAWPGIIHRCYRNSVLETALSAAVYASHRFIGTWDKRITLYIAPSKFVRQRLVEAGFNPSRIVVKPHFSEASVSGPIKVSAGDYLLFAGRLSTEKGLQLLLSACKAANGVPVLIAGDGPLQEELQATIQTQEMQQVRYLGFVQHEELQALMLSTRALVVPSLVYESFGKVIVEAAALGVPSIVPSGGALMELVEEGVTGLVFKSGSAGDLANLLRWSWEHPEEMARMGGAAREACLRDFNAETNYRQLIAIYNQAVESFRAEPAATESA